MLLELHIQNLAVIEDARVDFTEGLNVFTGETGAGKSLIIGAFGVLLGLRTAGGMIRDGADQAQVTGLFEVHHPEIAGQIAGVLDQAVEPGEQLLIKRKLFATGRSSVSINGLPVTNAMVKHVGQLLVDIHGQHDHQHLLKPSNQLHILDAFARCTDDRVRFAERIAELRQLTKTRGELSAGADLRRQQLDLYEFQADEIDAADPQAGEFPELQARNRVLASLQRIKQDAGSAHSALYEAEGSVAERLQVITHLLIELAELDPDLDEITEQVRSSTLSLQESAFELGRYVDRLEHDPAEVAEVDDRLNILNRLVSKYGSGQKSDDPLGHVIAYREQIAEKIERLRSQDSDQTGINQRIEDGRAELAVIAKRLTKARTAAAKDVVPLVQAQLKELGMAEAAFDIGFECLTLDGNPGPSGLDAVEMLVRTNPGQPMQPLRKVASGGEMSRIMLALKSVLAGSDRISVLVFDEIDANIGGRLGTVIGKKLQQLAKPGGQTNAKPKAAKGSGDAHPSHQVLCITHLPQIAAFADNHLRITKAVTGKGKSRQTHTTVSPVTGKTRVEELAEMMAGKEVTATTRKQARELINAAG
jgi:DNA repair protein RecN (Recombination protein N)